MGRIVIDMLRSAVGKIIFLFALMIWVWSLSVGYYIYACREMDGVGYSLLVPFVAIYFVVENPVLLVIVMMVVAIPFVIDLLSVVRLMMKIPVRGLILVMAPFVSGYFFALVTEAHARCSFGF
jgi:hypothetical protein